MTIIILDYVAPERRSYIDIQLCIIFKHHRLVHKWQLPVHIALIQSIIHCLSIHVAQWALPPSVTSQVASLRQQLEEFQGRRGGGGRGGGDGGGGGVRDGTSARGGCGPEAPCSRSLAAMEHAQRQALEELQRQHERQMKEVENEKNRLLLEETQDTTRGQHIENEIFI